MNDIRINGIMNGIRINGIMNGIYLKGVSNNKYENCFFFNLRCTIKNNLHNVIV